MTFLGMNLNHASGLKQEQGLSFPVQVTATCISSIFLSAGFLKIGTPWVCTLQNLKSNHMWFHCSWWEPTSPGPNSWKGEISQQQISNSQKSLRDTITGLSQQYIHDSCLSPCDETLRFTLTGYQWGHNCVGVWLKHEENV